MNGFQESFENVAININGNSFMYRYKNKYYEGSHPLESHNFASTVRKWVKDSLPTKTALIEATAGNESLDSCARALDEFLHDKH